MSSGLLKTLGVRIRRVADLDEGAIYIEDRKLLLLDTELTDEQMAEAIDALMPEMSVPLEQHPTTAPAQPPEVAPLRREA